MPVPGRLFLALLFTVLAELCLGYDTYEQLSSGPDWMLPSGIGLGLLAVLAAVVDRIR